MKYIIALSGLLVVSMGCTEKETDSAEEAEEESAFAPTEGEWGAGEFVTTVDTCGFDDEGDEGQNDEPTDSPMTLSMVDEANFTLSCYSAPINRSGP